MGNITIDTSNPYDGLQGLDSSQLKELVAAANNVIEARRSEEKKEAMDQIKRLAAEHGIQVDLRAEGGKAGKSRTPLPPKFANPDNPEQTWSGRGARPKWFKQALEAGKSEDEMLIQA